MTNSQVLIVLLQSLFLILWEILFSKVLRVGKVKVKILRPLKAKILVTLLILVLFLVHLIQEEKGVPFWKAI